VPKYRNALIAQLARQFAYTPRRRKLEQLQRLQEFAPSLQPEKTYPYDFVCYQVTRFRPEDAPHVVFDGVSLKADLMTLLHELSDSLDLPLAWAGVPVLTLDEVRRTYDVSLKTVRRWRAKGLVALRYVFPDGRKRTGVRRSDLEAFVEANPEIIGRTRAYSHVDASTRRAILARAFELSLTDELSPSEAIGRLAREFSHSHSAIGDLLRSYDATHPEAPIFAPGAEPLTDEERRQVVSLYRNGYRPAELARTFLLGRSTVDRVVRELVVEEILGRDWSYVADSSFGEPGAEEEILGALLVEGLEERGVAGPLTPEQEQRLFRQFNFLKFRLAKARDELSPSDLVPPQLERLVRLHDAAIAVRNCLVVANLRLVVYLASRHLGSGQTLDELVSDGTVSLMQAIERFDFTRGVRFSTYASWAIRKNFAKSLPRENRERRAARTGAQELIENTPDPHSVGSRERELRELLRSLVASLLLELSPREREVVVARFGLGRQRETLEQIGRRFRVTRERVRQIESRALRKLADFVDPELIEDLASPRR